ncbi:MAG: response regulator [Ignavibacteriaceae bacterium]|nr:response regulator [Ignavibacteriaceae bacterium]
MKTSAKILIVEDENIVAMDIRKMLLESGYEITSIVNSGEEAIQVVREQKPDLILMDIVLKGKMTGIDASRIITQYFDVPIIYLTALSSDDSLLEAKSRESYGFLFKPFGASELNIAIEMAFINRGIEEGDSINQS